MCEKGEMDMRGCYIVVVISKLLNIQTPDLLEGVEEYLINC